MDTKTIQVIVKILTIVMTKIKSSNCKAIRIRKRTESDTLFYNFLVKFIF